MNAGFEKLKAYAPIFEVSIGQSDYCRAVKTWLDQQLAVPEDARETAREPA